MMKGDSVAISIWVDLSRAIRTKGVLTFKQKRYLMLWADGWTQYDIAVKYSIAQKNVSARIDAGISNIFKYLTGRVYYTPSHGILVERAKYENKA